MKLGYARVSRSDQDLSLQTAALEAAGVDQIFSDKISGAKHDRDGLNELLKLARKGDTVIVWRLDRLARSLPHLIELANHFADRGIQFHLGGIMNTVVPEKDIPSHQGPDAQTVDPKLDVITSAVKVPETLSHLHYWNVQLTRTATTEEVLEAFSTSKRTAFISYSDGLSANNAVKELMLGLGRPYGDMYEVALWEDMIKVVGDEAFYAYLVDNQAIVIPETIDAIRAVTGKEESAQKSIEKTNRSFGIKTRFKAD